MENSFMSDLPISIKERELIANEIIKGKWGEDGQQFASTKILAEKRGISIVTAHNVLSALCDKNLLELRGKKYFLNYSEALKQKTDKHKIIGLHINNINNEYFSHIAKELEKQARNNGYKLIVSESNYDYRREKEIIDMFKDIKVSGIVSCPGVDDNTKSIYKNLKIPLIFLGRTPKQFEWQSVQINQFPVAVQVANHLVKQGYKNFVYIALDEIGLNDDLKFLGFRSGLCNNGYDIADENVLSLHVKNDIEFKNKISEFLKTKDKPLGIFCYHDLIAFQVLKACFGEEYKTPEDVGIVGFDNLEITKSVMLEISTVDHCIDQVVEMGFQKLVGQIEHQEFDKTNYFIEPKFIVRNSTDINVNKK